MSELAEVVAVSREQLTRWFRGQYGLGIITALELVRLARQPPYP